MIYLVAIIGAVLFAWGGGWVVAHLSNEWLDGAIFGGFVIYWLSKRAK